MSDRDRELLEKSLRSKIVELLSSLLAFPVENSVASCMPDVCCVLGWIETKIGRMPINQTAIVDVLVRDGQREWLTNWRRAGARAWTITQISPAGEIYLHDAMWSGPNLGRVSRREFEHASIASWKRLPAAGDLISALGRKYEPPPRTLGVVR